MYQDVEIIHTTVNRFTEFFTSQHNIPDLLKMSYKIQCSHTYYSRNNMSGQVNLKFHNDFYSCFEFIRFSFGETFICLCILGGHIERDFLSNVLRVHDHMSGLSNSVCISIVLLLIFGQMKYF